MPVHQPSVPAPRSSTVSWLAGRLDRRAMGILVALLAVGAAMYFGWDWLAAAGLTAFIVGLLPCALMCAAGLCASRLFGKQAACHGKDDAASSTGGDPGAKGGGDQA